MKIRVLFFGLTRDLTGLSEESVDVCEGESIEGLWRAYEGRFPGLRNVSTAVQFALNEELARRGQQLRDGDELAVMPPVSGGTDQSFYALTHEAIRAEDLSRHLRRPEAGAVAVFEGIVRRNSDGRRTLYLEYEAYEPLALRKMREIGDEAKRRFAIDGLAIMHRVGRLEIGETSVAIVVTAAHRGPAFEACRYAIDRLKQIVPIWKKEYFEDGAVWAEGEGQGMESMAH
jgi:molybdopterin synthase catalytic subunit/molybdopterin converting factor small subunit